MRILLWILVILLFPILCHVTEFDLASKAGSANVFLISGIIIASILDGVDLMRKLK